MGNITDDDSAVPVLDAIDTEVSRILDDIPTPTELQQRRLSPKVQTFDVNAGDECDGDVVPPSAASMAFVHYGGNLRARCYALKPADRLTAQRVVGRLVPSLITTASVVGGLMALEYLKVLQNKRNIDAYHNNYFNLALALMTSAAPLPAPLNTIRDGQTFTLWDKFEVTGPKTIQDLLDWYEDEHEIEVSMISCGQSLLWAMFARSAGERRKMLIEDVYT